MHGPQPSAHDSPTLFCEEEFKKEFIKKLHLLVLARTDKFVRSKETN